jgi:hypothetical protein
MEGEQQYLPSMNWSSCCWRSQGNASRTSARPLPASAQRASSPLTISSSRARSSESGATSASPRYTTLAAASFSHTRRLASFPVTASGSPRTDASYTLDMADSLGSSASASAGGAGASASAATAEGRVRRTAEAVAREGTRRSKPRREVAAADTSRLRAVEQAAVLEPWRKRGEGRRGLNEAAGLWDGARDNIVRSRQSSSSASPAAGANRLAVSVCHDGG